MWVLSSVGWSNKLVGVKSTHKHQREKVAELCDLLSFTASILRPYLFYNTSSVASKSPSYIVGWE